MPGQASARNSRTVLADIPGKSIYADGREIAPSILMLGRGFIGWPHALLNLDAWQGVQRFGVIPKSSGGWRLIIQTHLIK